MKVHVSRCSAALMSSLALVVIIAAAQDTPQTKKMLAVNAIRTVNNAELRFQRSKRHYASFSELVNSGQFSNLGTNKAGNAPPVLDIKATKEEDVVAGYKMTLLVGTSGTSYSIFLYDASDSCQVSFFSDSRGLIFQGHPLGCEPSNGALPGTVQ